MEKLREAIAQRIQESGISIRQIARICDTSEGNIRNILKGRVQNPRIDTLERICKACGTTLDSILASQDRASPVPPPCVTSDASSANSGKECVTSDAKTPVKPDKNVNTSADSKNIYNGGRLFSDENGDEALLMCHTLANTGHSYHGDGSDLQYRHAMVEDAEAEVRSLQERLEKAIAARDKLKGGGK